VPGLDAHLRQGGTWSACSGCTSSTTTGSAHTGDSPWPLRMARTAMRRAPPTPVPFVDATCSAVSSTSTQERPHESWVSVPFTLTVSTERPPWHTRLDITLKPGEPYTTRDEIEAKALEGRPQVRRISSSYAWWLRKRGRETKP